MAQITITHETSVCSAVAEATELGSGELRSVIYFPSARMRTHKLADVADASPDPPRISSPRVRLLPQKSPFLVWIRFPLLPFLSWCQSPAPRKVEAKAHIGDPSHANPLQDGTFPFRPQGLGLLPRLERLAGGYAV